MCCVFERTKKRHRPLFVFESAFVPVYNILQCFTNESLMCDACRDSHPTLIIYTILMMNIKYTEALADK